MAELAFATVYNCIIISIFKKNIILCLVPLYIIGLKYYVLTFQLIIWFNALIVYIYILKKDDTLF